jgi:DNA-binding beta-propeller fold protein YncE/plastocyanin
LIRINGNDELVCIYSQPVYGEIAYHNLRKKVQFFIPACIYREKLPPQFMSRQSLLLFSAVIVALMLTASILAMPMSISNSNQAQATTTTVGAHFETTDDPASWFRNEAGPIAGTQSLAIIAPGEKVLFTMEETNTVHTVTSLLWPTDAANMPFDQNAAFQGEIDVTLEDPGLYVFVCKLHPFMLAAVIADDPETDALDLGETIDVVNGIEDLPTSSDLATRLLRTFFIATNPDNWQDFRSDEPWHVEYPDVEVQTDLDDPVNLKDVLESRYGQDIELPGLKKPKDAGVGEILVDTQYETTDSKDKPGTVTIVDAQDWKVTRKVALPEVNMNNPHNMWTDKDQQLIYQTNWFDKYLTTFDRETGELVAHVEVGEAPAHVMTRTDTDQVHVSINGEDTVAELSPGGETVERQIDVSGDDDPAQPHAHWMGHDGQTMVTPNSNTADSTLYSFADEEIAAKIDTGALPIATGMMPDSSKYYVSNFLDSTVSVIHMETEEKIKDINLLADYNPITGELSDEDDNGEIAIGGLPIQIPVSPNGKYAVTANTLTGTIIIIDTDDDEIEKMLACDAGCHGVNFGAKEGGGYYAYVSSKFANTLIVVDIDPDQDGEAGDAEIVGRVALTAQGFTETDDNIDDYKGMGGQGVLPVPLVYNGWVQNLPNEWKDELTEEQLDPLGEEEDDEEEEED